MSAQILQFPGGGARLGAEVAEVERHVEAWIGKGGSWLAYSEQIARWVVDQRGLSDMLRRFDAAGGRAAYAEQHGIREWDASARLVCAELAAEYLETVAG